MPLSDDQFNELLQKRLNREDGEHYTEDDLLSEEDKADLSIMREALGSYKAESLAWAEKRSATMPSPHSNAVVSLWDRTPRWAFAGAALAACAVAAVTFNYVAKPLPASIAVAPTAQALAADNQLLSSVDAALAGGASAPTEQELGLSSTSLLTGVHDTQRHGGTRNFTN